MLIPLLGFAQRFEVPIKFETSEHDFGEIKEVEGKVTKRFRFRNVSNQTIKLKDVVVACGCTSPNWPKQALQAQDTASIFITFDPTDRPGAFNKYIRVEIEGIGKPIYLIIKGKVLPRPPGPRDWFPFRLGNLWFKQQNMFVGSLYQKEQASFQNKVYNAGNEPVEILLNLSKLPSFLAVQFEKLVIPPKDSIQFTLTYHARKRKDWGFVTDPFLLKTTDTVMPNKELGVGVILKERFKKNTKKNPKISVAKTTFDFGEVPVGQHVIIDIQIKNTGNKALKFRKLNLPACNCITAKLPQKRLNKGKEMSLQVTVNTENRYAWQSLGLTLITNDPKNHLLDLRIEGNIVDKEK
ncbi:MAG: DUF1573 domain-containing protein [Flammeovirgaceae bacterium]